MSRALSTVIAVLLLLGVVAPVSAGEPDPSEPAAPPAGEVIPGEVIVQFRSGIVPDATRLDGLAIVSQLGTAADGAPVLVSTDGRPVEQVVAELSANPSVAAVEPNYRVELADAGSVTVAVDDPKTADQYSLDRMRVRSAWSVTTGGSNVIAVLDTGVQLNHPDLAGRIVAGYDFVNDDTNASDDNGHGTWVSGIIAANANDGYGIAGISWTDKIMPVKIMNGEGTGSTADLLSAIRWSADHGADVINMSVGGFPYSQLLQDAVNYAWNKGAVLVGAAGNNRREEVYYPASFDNVISVSATQPEDEFSNWSSYGPEVDLSAPGSSILTTNCYACTYADHDSWGTHTYISGTSFATPNVAGVVALIRAKYPSYSPSQVVSRLFSTVDDLGYAGWDNRYGRGRVNAYRAVGASVTAAGSSTGDAAEPNNTLAAARAIPVGTATRPSLYPAGDVDVFAVDVPRAGRLDVRVTGVVDTRAYPWNKSGLPIDPIVELYDTAGTLLVRVDVEWESGTELASVSVGGPTRILVRIRNYYPNGNRAAYQVTPSYVDTVGPVATIVAPAAGATNVSRAVAPRVTFNEPVANVSSSSVLLRDTVTGAAVPATVAYDGPTRTATLTPSVRLGATRQYRVEVTAGVTDVAGNPVAARSQAFTTGVALFDDTVSSPFVGEINWLVEDGVTNGCAETRFCPLSEVTREQMASFLSRALALPATATDYFRDDEASLHETDINRAAAAGLTRGCGQRIFCPAATVTRAQMASFLARALDLPAASVDFFTDDAGSPHEADINRVAAAGITLGCTSTTYCPTDSVTREQMAAFLYRGFATP